MIKWGTDQQCANKVDKELTILYMYFNNIVIINTCIPTNN